MPSHRKGFLLAVLLAAGIACQPQPPTLGPDCPPSTAVEQRLVLRGDSLGAFAEPLAKPGLVAGQPGPVCYWARGMTQIDEHQPALPLIGEGDCVLMELGTNDLLKEVFAKGLADLHLAATELLDADTQVWFTLNETGAALHGWPYDVRVDWFNAELLAMDADDVRWPNLVVWRWDLESAGHPEWLNLPDDLHYSRLGNEIYARTVVQAASACT